MKKRTKDEHRVETLYWIDRAISCAWIEKIIPEGPKNCLLRNGIRSDAQFFDQWLMTDSSDWQNFGKISKDKVDAAYWDFIEVWRARQRPIELLRQLADDLQQVR